MNFFALINLRDRTPYLLSFNISFMRFINFFMYPDFYPFDDIIVLRIITFCRFYDADLFIRVDAIGTHGSSSFRSYL